MQARVARESITASTLRGAVANTIAHTRSFLWNTFSLRDFANAAATDFEKAHNGIVTRLESHLKKQNCSSEFGRCAKALDIFLRSVVAHHHLRTAYDLDFLEPSLHLPLDSLTMAKLRDRSRNGRLSTKSIVKLSQKEYMDYQEAAACLVADGECRVWLDDDWWGVREQ